MSNKSELPNGFMKTEKILAIIPARGGSKGLPGKNIRPLAGLPLIAHSISLARRCPEITRTIVSTDSEEIASVARQYGAEVPFIRPAELSTDTASSQDVVLHALHWMQKEENFYPDFILLLQPTSPLRSLDDILSAINMQIQKDADAIVSVRPVSHPASWLIGLSENGKLLPVQDSGVALRRQDAGLCYQFNGALYLVKTSIFFKEHTFIPENTYALVMPPERSIDIDTPWDWRLTELILKDQHEQI